MPSAFRRLWTNYKTKSGNSRVARSSTRPASSTQPARTQQHRKSQRRIIKSNQIYLAAQNNPKNTIDFTDKATRQTRVLAIGLKGRKTALTWAPPPFPHKQKTTTTKIRRRRRSRRKTRAAFVCDAANKNMIWRDAINVSHYAGRQSGCSGCASCEPRTHWRRRWERHRSTCFWHSKSRWTRSYSRRLSRLIGPIPWGHSGPPVSYTHLTLPTIYSV